MRIAIVDDNPLQRRHLRGILERSGRAVLEFADGAEAWDHLADDPSVQLIVTDWMMPNLDGPGLIRRVRGAALPYYVYILLLTARGERDDIVAGLHSGADDYLTKPIDVGEFVARVAVGERILSLERQLRAAHDEQRYLASHDLLTGALTRRALYDHILALGEGYGPLSLVIIDVDHFKSVNDRYGHQAGDVALQTVARAIQGALRTSDWVARWGGEEFAVVLPHASHQAALAIAERIRRAIARASAVIADAASLQLTASLGVATAGGLGHGTFDLLIQQADLALYEAKASGRNSVWSAEVGLADVAPAPDPAPEPPPPPRPAAPAPPPAAPEGAAPAELPPADGLIAVARLRRPLAAMAHDVRGAFSGIIGLAELLMESEIDPESREHAASIKAASRRLLDTFEQLLQVEG